MNLSKENDITGTRLHARSSGKTLHSTVWTPAGDIKINECGDADYVMEQAAPHFIVGPDEVRIKAVEPNSIALASEASSWGKVGSTGSTS